MMISAPHPRIYLPVITQSAISRYPRQKDGSTEPQESLPVGNGSCLSQLFAVAGCAQLLNLSWASVSGGCQPAHGSHCQPSNGPNRSGFPRRRLIPRSRELLHFSWSSSVRSGFPRRRLIPGSRELLHFGWSSSCVGESVVIALESPGSSLLWVVSPGKGGILWTPGQDALLRADARKCPWNWMQKIGLGPIRPGFFIFVRWDLGRNALPWIYKEHRRRFVFVSEFVNAFSFLLLLVYFALFQGYCQYVVATKKRWNLRVKILTFCRVNSAALGIRAEIVVFHFAESGNGILFVCRCCQKKVDFKGREIDLLPGQQRRT
ncbi:uncharacterized protein LOC26535308 isoform X2 [Drosophila yakuba]|uniref:uncharacterized protein LOC26535308 isoform X2 n=2 Tax=Drosophila yakuba TaxID=7245 RepID=UPI001C89EBFB|nr:uncharacterized protein LOC26535308 isoform X2 [Drosophila yakuba]